MSVFLIVSSLIVDFAWWLTYILAVISAVSILFMLALRRVTSNNQRKDELIRHEWEDILYDAVEPLTLQQAEYLLNSVNENPPEELLNSPLQLPEKSATEVFSKLAKSDIKEFLYSWNYLHESLKGEAKERLNVFADTLSLKENALKALNSNRLDKKLLAIQTLGNFGEKDTWDDVFKFANHPDPIISLWATRALFRIDVERALRELLPLLAVRLDWSPIYVGKMLKELSSDVISEPLSNFVAECYLNKLADKQMGKIISYLSMAHPSDYSHIVNYIFERTDGQETLIACLKLVNSKQVSSRIRACLDDERWQVRMHAVQTLGRLGYQKDIKLLIVCLNDLEWWVRYRSACALAFDPSVSREKVVKLSRTLPNEFAKDILTQVLAEIRMKCLQPPSSINLSK